MKIILFLATLMFYVGAYAEELLPDLVIEEITTDVFLHKSYSRVKGYGLVSSNGLVVVNQGKAFIIDTPWSTSDTQKLISWIEKQGFEPIGSISTHSHEDRTAGIAWLNARLIPTYATALTNSLLKSANKALASNTIDKSEANLADGLVEIYYPGGGHSMDNIVVWLPKSKVLFGGCFVRSLGARSLGNIADAEIEQWPNSIDNVMKKYIHPKLVVPGHGEIGDVQLLKHTRKIATQKFVNTIL